MYLSYTNYQQMGGTLEETAFNDLEYEASVIIRHRTFNRLAADTTIPEEVQRCVYQLIKLVQQKNNLLATNKSELASNVSSQSNDGVSISYNVLSAQDLSQKVEDAINNTMEIELMGVTNNLGQLLLYRGVYFNE